MRARVKIQAKITQSSHDQYCEHIQFAMLKLGGFKFKFL